MWSKGIEAMPCLLQCPEMLEKGMCCEWREASDVAAGPGNSHSRDNIKQKSGPSIWWGEESDCDIEMIGEDSEDDVVNSETESESEEDQRGMVDRVLNSVSSPSHWEGADWEMVYNHCKVEKEKNIIHCQDHAPLLDGSCWSSRISWDGISNT